MAAITTSAAIAAISGGQCRWATVPGVKPGGLQEPSASGGPWVEFSPPLDVHCELEIVWRKLGTSETRAGEASLGWS